MKVTDPGRPSEIPRRRARLRWLEYARILAVARVEGRQWYAAVCLAGEGGLRIGEIRALKWREHVDLVGGTITVAEQTRHGITGTPKGGKRRVVWMGHGRIDETMLYVHVASAHHRPLPAELRLATGTDDPDRRILTLLGQRASVTWGEPDRRCIARG